MKPSEREISTSVMTAEGEIFCKLHLHKLNIWPVYLFIYKTPIRVNYYTLFLPIMVKIYLRCLFFLAFFNTSESHKISYFDFHTKQQPYLNEFPSSKFQREMPDPSYRQKITLNSIHRVKSLARSEKFTK